MAAMKDVLELYTEPYDPKRPAACFDETSTKLLAEIRGPPPAKPGRPRREATILYPMPSWPSKARTAEAGGLSNYLKLARLH